MAEVGQAMVGPVDVIVLGAVALVAVYWFYRRNKKEEVPEVKQFSVAPTLQRSASFDPSFTNKMKRTGRNVVVFYGSQSGTAEEFASRLAKDAVRLGWKGMVADPEECEMEDLPKLNDIQNSLAIFCMATYGEGDPTDNAQGFFDWLQEGGENLEGLNYAVFGLGNKTYEHYNKMGKYCDERLEELGATRVYKLGLGDDDSNIEQDFVTWREGFWPAVAEHYGIEATGEEVSMRQFEMENLPEEIPKEKIFSGEAVRLGSYRNQKPPFDMKNPYMSPIYVNKELHKGGDRSCMHIELDISDSKIRYEAGDHVAIYPMNDAHLVESLGNRLGVDLDQVFSLINIDDEASKKHPFPCPCSYRTALLYYLDIQHAPRTNVLKDLIEYATDEKDKQILLDMVAATPEGKDLYNEWIMKDGRNILSLLEDLPSLNPPLDHICELLPRLQPRYYSISSSNKLFPDKIHITAILVNWETRLGRRINGVCTTWLKPKIPTDELKPKVPIFVRKSQFRLPFKPSVPVIMIGPGTGIAPFRGFIQDRHCQKRDGKMVGDTILYTGFRKEKEDFLYEDELQDYINHGTLTKLHVAFSRDQKEKVYVQHLLRQNKTEVWKALDAGGHLYVCGDARHMAHDVDNALQDIVAECGEMDKSKASEYLKKMRSRGRYSCDVWS